MAQNQWDSAPVGSPVDQPQTRQLMGEALLVQEFTTSEFSQNGMKMNTRGMNKKVQGSVRN